MYHYVRNRSGTEDHGLRGLDPTTFMRQIDQLCAELEPIDWSSLANWKTGRGSIPERSFLLTFDDSLSDHAEVVAPILESRSLRGVFFVSTAPYSTGRLLCAHQVHLLLARIGADRLREEIRRWLMDHQGVDAANPSVDSAAARAMYDYEPPELAELKYLLARVMAPETRRQMIDAIYESCIGSSREAARHWYMGLAELGDLSAAGHTIGGHGHDHELYSTLDDQQQARDLRRCASFLHEGLGAQPRPFSYPYGDFDHRLVKQLPQAGFVQGFTTRKQWITRASDDFTLGRCDAIAVESFLELEPTCT